MYYPSKNRVRVGRSRRLLFKAITCLLLSLAAASLPFTAAEAGTQRRDVKRTRRVGKRPRVRAGAAARVEKKRPTVTREREGVSGEDPDGRADWFYFKRAYPFGRVPAEARRVAWESSRKERKGAREQSVRQQVWTPIGPAPTRSELFENWGLTSGRINTIAVSPSDPQVVLLGAATGGIWRSADGGQTFAPVSDDQVDLAVGAIAFAPSAPSVVYAGMGDLDNGYVGTGVLKSLDGGRTWARISDSTLPPLGLINDIAVDPTNPNRVYVAQTAVLDRALSAFTESGFFLSNDGGVSWVKTLGGNARNVAVHPTNPQTLYLSMRFTQNDSTGGVYRSNDGGQTWTEIYKSPYTLLNTRDVRVALTPADPQRIYVYVGKTNGGAEARLEVSTNGGATWSNRGAACLDAGQVGYNTYLHASPADANTIYVGSRDIYKSTDGGLTWTNLTSNFIPPFSDKCSFAYAPRFSKAHADQHSFAFSPSDPQVFYAGNDGGVYKSVDGGHSFQSLNSTLSLTQFVHLALHPTNPVSYGGAQDNGMQRRAPGTLQWDEVFSGDGGRTVIDPIDPSIVYPSYIRGEIFRFFNGGEPGSNFDAVASAASFGEFSASPRIAFYPPIVGNGVDHKLYSGSWRLFVCTDCHDPARLAVEGPGVEATTWTAPAGALDLTKGGIDVLNAIAVARSNTNVIYTGSALGRAMVSTNGGASWTDVTSGLPNRFIESITIDPFNPSAAYLTVSGYGSGHVFKTTNLGATWTDVSGNLPDIPTACLLFDPLRPSTVYVGTDVGVFRSTAGGNTWESFNEGMPPVIVTALVSQPSGRIQAATYGRGAFEFVQSPPPPASVSFDAASASASESDGRVRLTVTRPDPAGAASVDYATSDATASGRNDYTAAFGTLKFAPGETARTLDVLLIDDAFAEPPETFKVTLSNPAGLTLASPSAVAVTIDDNDAASRQSPLRWTPDFDSRFFVRQHYLDFLGREPDQAGWDFWTNEIESCGANQPCREVKRINVSAAFFLSIEFQETGFLVYKTCKGAFGNLQGKPAPVTFERLAGDSRRIARGIVVGRGDWQAQLEGSKQEFFNEWVLRPEFVARYPAGTTPQEFVKALDDNAGGVLTPAERAALVGRLASNNTTSGRALVLRQVAENAELSRREKNRAFVLMQYFGYLRRNPDDAPNTDFSGYQFWLDKLNLFQGNFVEAEMVKAFLTSDEYQQRAGQ
jgi:photosystem II stability/assembly factor-like uncharacterized protein